MAHGINSFTDFWTVFFSPHFAPYPSRLALLKEFIATKQGRQVLNICVTFVTFFFFLPLLTTIIWRCKRRYRSRRIAFREISLARLPHTRHPDFHGWLVESALKHPSQSSLRDHRLAIESSPLFIDPHPTLPISKCGVVAPPPSPSMGWQILQDRPIGLCGQWPMEAEIRSGRWDSARDSQSTSDLVDTEVPACGEHQTATVYHQNWWGWQGNEQSRRTGNGQGYMRPTGLENKVDGILSVPSRAFFDRVDQHLDWNRREVMPIGLRYDPMTRRVRGLVIADAD